MKVEIADATAPAASTPTEFPIRFTGSGKQYFRIWIVNLLLTLATLGIYLPWASARRLRYFYGNTLIGTTPLAFHGEPIRMLPLYALTALAVGACVVIGWVWPLGMFIAPLVAGAAWPALRHSSLKFRTDNTSWRGRRFAFTGSSGDAYRELLPSWQPTLLLGSIVATSWVGPPLAISSSWAMSAAGGLLLLGPLSVYRLKRHLHDHCAYAAERSRLQLRVIKIYGLALKAAAFALVLSVPTSLTAQLILSATSRVDSEVVSYLLWTGLLPIVLFAGCYLLLMSLIGTYVLARLQNLVWSAVASRRLHMTSHVRARDLLKLTLKFWLFMPLTLGLYWPFARVAFAQARLSAVAVHIDEPPDASAALPATRP